MTGAVARHLVHVVSRGFVRRQLNHIKLLVLPLLASLLIATLPGVVRAGATGYDCTVEAELALGDDGRLASYPRPLTIGHRFIFDRRTGLLVQSDNALVIFPDSEVVVRASGNLSNAFVVTYLSRAAGGGVHAAMLRVVEFAPGAKKPFVMLNGGTVHAGTCQ